MRWQIKQFVFCDQQLTLSFGDQQQQLEPMVAELLKYFCQHPQEIVSRDQLIDNVWLGRIVTDNAVNRVITKLRRYLNDDPKQPEFVATFPKKGYKFIAPITVIEDAEQGTSSAVTGAGEVLSEQVKEQAKLGLMQVVGGAFILLMFSVALMWLFSETQQDDIYPITQVKSLTRGAGADGQPQLSPNQQYLAYTMLKNGRMHLFIKSLNNDEKIEITHASGAWVGPASWNNSGSKIAYLVTTENSCQYFIREFEQMTLSEPKLIHNCPAGSYGKIMFTHNDDWLIYSEAKARGEPFELFKLRLSTGTKTRLNQPALVLGGNSQYDLHPTKNHLLLSSPDEQQWEGFYRLDIEENELSLLFKQDAFICCAIWDHSGTQVVLMGEHPATSIESFDLTGERVHTIFQSSQQVLPPSRHTNGRDYLFASGVRDKNIKMLKLDDNTLVNIANASVQERLARFSFDGQQIAYISEETGSEEIWLYQQASQSAYRLTQFGDGRHYVDLTWSYNGQFIAALKLNEIDVINSKTGETTTLNMPQGDIRGMSFKSDEWLAFSVKTDKQWQLYYYHLPSSTLEQAEQAFAFVRFAKNEDDILWLDHQGILYAGQEKVLVEDQQIQAADFVAGRHFNLAKQGQEWMWQHLEGANYQLFHYRQTSQQLETITSQPSSHFDWLGNAVLVSEIVYVNSDIFQTVAQ